MNDLSLVVVPTMIPNNQEITRNDGSNGSLVMMNNEDIYSSVECCFICGASQAIWPLNSKPTSDNKPFFPFLQYQKAPPNANNLGSDGICFSCNVCYLFLIQQWKSYEANRTPILKRLYWLKRPSDEYINPEDESDNSMVKTKRNSPVRSECGELEIKNNYNRNSQLFVGGNKGSVMKEIDFVDLNNEKASCSLCSLNDRKSSMSYVFTTPQQSSGIPFYPDIIKETYNDHNQVSIDGRVLLCNKCTSKLHRKWLEFENNSIPVSDRKYSVYAPSCSKEPIKLCACFMCSDILSQGRRQVLYCRSIERKAFYPFLKNLPTPYNAVPITQEGFTYGCENCNSFLLKQWDVFEDSNVSQEERVYRIHPSQPPLLPSTVGIGTTIACYICSKNNDLKNLKRVYCNSGSNMNLGFLKSFPRNKDGLFCEDTGETFVCLTCFAELRQHWVKYRSTLFNSDDTGHNQSGINKNIYKETNSVCELCFSLTPHIELSKLHITPSVTGLQDEKPFFPTLEKIKSNENTDPVSACQLCSLNLLKQWSAYENDNSSVLSKMERKYRIFYFLCYVCDKLIHNKDISLVNIGNIKKNTEMKASLFSLKIEDDIIVCGECKEECTKNQVTFFEHFYVVLLYVRSIQKFDVTFWRMVK